MRILGIETSCDETGIAIYDGNKGLLANIIHTQLEPHSAYGGVVPELASRDHIRKTLGLIKSALNQADLTKNQLDGIAYTAGPGLIGALMVGSTLARSLGWALGIPTLGVHHLEGHILAIMLEKDPPEFPFLTLLVSGGHTLLVQVTNIGDYKIIGESLDDAAGEAFDKTAKLLGLGYPGGAALAALAEQGDPSRFTFPRPMTDRPGLDFSFSGLKTFAVTTLQKHGHNHQTRADIACAFQAAVVDTLVIKSRRALDQTGLKNLVLAGGVGANQALRNKLTELVTQRHGKAYFPRPIFCTDNGAMIAYTGYQRIKMGELDSLEIQAKARWSLEELLHIHGTS